MHCKKDSAHYKEHYTLSTALNTTALRDTLNHPVPPAAAVFLLSPLEFYGRIGLAGILDFTFSNPSSCYVHRVCSFSVPTYIYISAIIYLHSPGEGGIETLRTSMHSS